MIAVYIAGPLMGPMSPSGFDAWHWEQNVRRAEELAVELTLAGFAVVCVHLLARHTFGHIAEEAALGADMELIRRCDVLALVEGWQRSKGTLKEIAFARSRGMPVFGDESQLVAGTGGAAGAERVRQIVDEMLHWSAERVTQEIDENDLPKGPTRGNCT